MKVLAAIVMVCLAGSAFAGPNKVCKPFGQDRYACDSEDRTPAPKDESKGEPGGSGNDKK